MNNYSKIICIEEGLKANIFKFFCEIIDKAIKKIWRQHATLKNASSDGYSISEGVAGCRPRIRVEQLQRISEISGHSSTIKFVAKE